MSNSSEILLITILFLVGIRNFLSDSDKFVRKNRIYKAVMTKIVAAFLVSLLSLFLFLKVTLVHALVLYFLTSNGLQLLIIFSTAYENRKLDDVVVSLIGKILLHINAGFSLNQATERALQSLDAKISSRIRLILRQEARNKTLFLANPKFERFVTTYWYLLENKHQTTKLLTRLRKQLLSEAAAKSRYKRAMSNIYTQVAVLLFLYLGGLFYIIPGLQKFEFWFLISISLIFSGSILFFFLHRSFKWTA